MAQRQRRRLTNPRVLIDQRRPQGRADVRARAGGGTRWRAALCAQPGQLARRQIPQHRVVRLRPHPGERPRITRQSQRTQRHHRSRANLERALRRQAGPQRGHRLGHRSGLRFTTAGIARRRSAWRGAPSFPLAFSAASTISGRTFGAWPSASTTAVRSAGGPCPAAPSNAAAARSSSRAPSTRAARARSSTAAFADASSSASGETGGDGARASAAVTRRSSFSVAPASAAASASRTMGLFGAGSSVVSASTRHSRALALGAEHRLRRGQHRRLRPGRPASGSRARAVGRRRQIGDQPLRAARGRPAR